MNSHGIFFSCILNQSTSQTLEAYFTLRDINQRKTSEGERFGFGFGFRRMKMQTEAPAFSIRGDNVVPWWSAIHWLGSETMQSEKDYYCRAQNRPVISINCNLQNRGKHPDQFMKFMKVVSSTVEVLDNDNYEWGDLTQKGTQSAKTEFSGNKMWPYRDSGEHCEPK